MIYNIYMYVCMRVGGWVWVCDCVQARARARVRVLSVLVLEKKITASSLSQAGCI